MIPKIIQRAYPLDAWSGDLAPRVPIILVDGASG